MPRATVDINETKRHDLKTLPEAFVVLRRYSYGQKLARNETATSMAVESTRGKKRDETTRTIIDVMQKNVTAMDFKECIVDHNLEDENGQLLDFRSASTLDKLHPQIGEEIASLIDGMNNFEAGEDPNS